MFEFSVTEWMERAIQDGLGSGQFEIKVSGACLDADSEHVIGQFIVWPNGYVETTIIDVATEDTAISQTWLFTTQDELDAAFRLFREVLVKTDLNGLP